MSQARKIVFSGFPRCSWQEMILFASETCQESTVNQDIQEEGSWMGRERQCSRCTAWCPVNALEVAEVPPSLMLIPAPMEVAQAAG